MSVAIPVQTACTVAFLPRGLESIEFGNRFNLNITNGDLPSGLRSLTFGANFNRSLGSKALPDGLEESLPQLRKPHLANNSAPV